MHSDAHFPPKRPGQSAVSEKFDMLPGTTTDMMAVEVDADTGLCISHDFDLSNCHTTNTMVIYLMQYPKRMSNVQAGSATNPSDTDSSHPKRCSRAALNADLASQSCCKLIQHKGTRAAGSCDARHIHNYLHAKDVPLATSRVTRVRGTTTQ